MSASRVVKVIGPFVVLFVCIFITYQLMQSTPSASKGRLKQVAPLLVDIETLSAKTFQIKVDSYGLLKANTQTDLFPLVAGQVVRVRPDFQRGAFVQSGQVLLEIDPLEYEVALQVAQGDLANAELALAEEEARSEQAHRDWKKTLNASHSEVSDFALRYPQLKAAKAALETAKAKLKLAKKNLARTKVRAPYDGRLIESHVNIGSVVSTSTRLAELYSTESLELSLPIANRDLEFLDLPSIESGKDIWVKIENTLVVPSQFWSAKITGTEALVDSDNQQIYALAKIEDAIWPEINQQTLKVGQYLQATIDGREIENAILLPNSSIYQGAYVYVVERREGVDVLVRRDIEVQWRNEEISLLKSGLKVGDKLVTTPLGQVTSGTRVSINHKNSHQENGS